MKFEKIKDPASTYFKYLLLAALMYTPIFGALDALPIRIWDESRITINACEMLYNGNYIVTSFTDSEDMWNTKPPLLIWMQVFWMKLIGINEIAIRLPSALGAFFTCLGLLAISVRYFQSFWLGFITILVLITTPGYIAHHVTRTGDYDSLLTMFTTLSGLCYFMYTESGKNKYLYLFFLMLTGAVLTKGIAGLLFTPALLLYTFIRKQFLPIFKNKHFYFGLAGFIFFGVGYYFLRELYNPGYIAMVSENELGGRYLESQGNQPFDELFYFDQLRQHMMADRYFLIPIGVVIGFCSGNQKIRRYTLFITLAMVSFFLIISFGKTRLEHYLAPVFPFFAASIALLIHDLFNRVRTMKLGRSTQAPQALAFLLLFLLFLFPYQKIFAKTYSPTEDFYTHYEFYGISRFYRDALNGKHDLRDHHLVYDGYDAQLMFYMYALKAKGVNTWKKQIDEVKPGDKLIVSQDAVRIPIREKYTYVEKMYKDGISTFTVTAKKKSG